MLSGDFIARYRTKELRGVKRELSLVRKRLKYTKWQLTTVLARRDSLKSTITAVRAEYSRLMHEVSRRGINIVTNKKYSPNEKLNVVELVQSSTLGKHELVNFLGLNKGTLSIWEMNYKTQGEEGLISHNVAPTPYNTIPNHIVEMILCYKHQYPYATAGQVAELITRSNDHYVHRTSIIRLFRNYGLTAHHDKSRKRFRKEIIRHGRYANDIWLSDFTDLLGRGPYRLYFISVMDDYSRYIVSWQLTTSQTTNDAVSVLSKALNQSKELLHSPITLIVDNGQCFKAKRFEQFCDESQIDRHYTRPYNPFGRIRIERFHRTLKEAISAANSTTSAEIQELLGEYIGFYNEFRAHQGLGGATPADIYFGGEPLDKTARDAIKARTIEYRRKYHQENAMAAVKPSADRH